MTSPSITNAGKISRRDFFLVHSPVIRTSRPYGNRPKRRYFLIVCEGEKTEPNYFQAIADQLPKDMVKRITIVGTGRSTLDLIAEARKEITKRENSGGPDFYYVWLVFDKDDFSSEKLETAIRKETLEKDFRYKKNDGGMFARLRGFTPTAIERAERALKRQLEQHGTDWACMNPATRVHELVHALMAYL